MKIMPNISVVFPGRVPKLWENDVEGWSFSQTEIATNVGKLLTLDIDLGEYCSLKCPWCFRKGGVVDATSRPVLTYEETLNVIRQAWHLGLRTVKFLGAGEPFENSRLLQFLRELRHLGIWASIFTKGHVLGSDELTEKYFGASEGIHSAKDLVRALSELDVSILLSFQSFDMAFQDSIVGVSGYTALRNNAIELLCSYGFNRTNPTRLALILVPVTKMTIAEVPEIYAWGRERNMYIIVAPSMCSGKAGKDEYRDTISPSEEDLLNLYAWIYRYNFDKGIQTLERVCGDGVSAYAGGAPCTQVSCGMYVTSRGIVLRCPGDDVTVLGDVRNSRLEEIWHASENYGRRGTFNCKCPPKDGKTIPAGLYEKVLAKLMEYG